MILKIRVILDSQEDIIRTLLFDASNNLEDLHFSLVDAFSLESGQMASFYLSDSDWNQGEEIPLFQMDESQGRSMQSISVAEVLGNPGSKMLFVYDFLNLWTFYIEHLEILDSTEQELPYLLLSVGDMPNEKEETSFETAKPSNQGFEDFEDPFDDEFPQDEFDNLDDLNFDEI